MKVAVLNKTERLIICGDITLIPGANYIEQGDVKHYGKMLEDKVKSGCVEMPEMDIEDDLAETTLGSYNAKDAVKLVKETNDYDTLMKFQIEEQSDKARKSVLEAIEAQIQLSKDALKNGEE